MKLIILSILLQSAAFAQTPEKDFLEISPEQEKKIQEREQKKKEAFYRKQAEEKKKIEELKKQLEEKKKIEEAQKLAAEKKAREEKIAAEARAAEEKKIAAEKKKRDEAEAYTKWLISERDRKMKEASKSSGASGSAGSSGSSGSSGTSGSGKNSQTGPSAQKTSGKSNYRTKYFHYTENDINGKSLSCRKTLQAKNWEQTFRDKVLSRKPEKLNEYFEKSLQTFICNCRFAKARIIPSDLKIVAMAGHEAAMKGPSVYRNSILGNVSVNIKEKGNVALILNTYESTKWTIHSGEAKIIAVVILGHHLQEVLMDTVAPVLLSSLNNNDPCDKYGARVSHHFKNVLERGDETSPAEEIQSISRVNEISLLLFGKTPEAVPYKQIFDPEISLPGR